MTSATKKALLTRYENELNYLDFMIDLNAKNLEAVKKFQEQYRKVAQLLMELAKTKASDE